MLCCLAAAGQAAEPPLTGRKALEAASKAYEAKDYEQALALLLPLAERDDAEAAFAVGLLAARGEGGERDLKNAERWWKKAADNGNALAAFNLGYLYFRGAIGPSDLAAARALWEQAAKKKQPDAMFGAALLQCTGAGGDKDMKGGLARMHEAASIGHPQAEHFLGLAYLEGNGVAKNRARAERYLARAAEKGLLDAARALEGMKEEDKDAKSKHKRGDRTER